MLFRSVFSFQGSLHFVLRTNRISIINMQCMIINKASGILLFSRVVSNKVPSAAQVLTVVFGMGTGISLNRIATGKKNFFLSNLDIQTAIQPLLSFRFL